MESLYQKLKEIWTQYESKQSQTTSKNSAKAKLGI